MPVAAVPPAKFLLLYDGQCRFCVASSTRLAAMARPGTIERVDLHDRATLARFPHAPQHADASTLRLVTREGRVAEGAEAIALALGTRPVARLVTWVYWLPVVRPLMDAMYRVMARHRFRIMGRVGVARGSEGCVDGMCRSEPTRPRRG